MKSFLNTVEKRALPVLASFVFSSLTLSPSSVAAQAASVQSATGPAPAAIATSGPAALAGRWVASGRVNLPPGQLARNMGNGNIPATQPGWEERDAHLQPEFLARVKADDARLSAGDPPPTSASTCTLDGFPAMLDVTQYPMEIIITPKRVYMLEEVNFQNRRIYINEQHPANIKPSWFGHSVGHWEGSVLVVDTVGMSAKTSLNWDGIPHSDKLHITERWQVVDGGLQAQLIMDDPIAFTKTWTVVKNFRRSAPKLEEYVCAEGTHRKGLPTE